MYHKVISILENMSFKCVEGSNIKQYVEYTISYTLLENKKWFDNIFNQCLLNSKNIMKTNNTYNGDTIEILLIYDNPSILMSYKSHVFTIESDEFLAYDREIKLNKLGI